MIGFIGFGEVSSNMVLGMLAEKDTDFVVYDTDVIRTRKQTDALDINGKVRIVETLSELLEFSDTIIVAIPGAYDKELFDEIKAERPKDILFIDLCTAPPFSKRQIESDIQHIGCQYVDTAIMGSVPVLKHKVPMYISGSGAEKMQQVLSIYKPNITVVGKKAGDASLVKLCRSIYMKGLAAISIEMTLVSRYYGVEEQVYKSLSDSLDNDTFSNYTPRLINGTFKHCERRLQEMKECLDIVQAAGETGEMTQATIDLYQKILK